jgi:hypothetical protein
MKRLGWMVAAGATALASGCGVRQGILEVHMPPGAAKSLAAVHVERPDGTARVTVASNGAAIAISSLPAGARRIVLGFANSNYQPPTEVAIDEVAIQAGAHKIVRLGALAFEVPESLPDLNLSGILVRRTGGGPPFELELKDNGNTHYFFKPKPLPEGVYEVAIRFSRSTAPSAVAAGVVVTAAETSTVTLDSGFVVTKPGGPRVEGWKVFRQGDTVPWLEVSRRSDNDEPLWRRVIAPPGAYTLVLRRAAPAGESPPEALVVAPGGLLAHTPAVAPGPP